MGYVVLTDELNEGKKTVDLKSSASITIDGIVSDLVDYFVKKKANLINDVEANKVSFAAIENEIDQYISREEIDIVGFTKEKIFNAVYNYLFKYYTFQEYLERADVTTITAIAKDNIWITRIINNVEMIFQAPEIYFDSDESYNNFCLYIARRNGIELNNKNAIRVVTDKTRCKNAILRIFMSGSIVNSNDLPCIIIRKTPIDKYTADDLNKLGMYSKEMQDYFTEIVEAGAQILTCGDGGSGKTTWMNAYIDLIDPNIKALFIQESEELHSKNKNLFFERIKKKSSESDTEYELGYLTRMAMVMSVKMIGIGEIKGPEAFDLFNAAYSGHIAWASVHTCSSEEALPKLIQYMQYSNINLKEELLLEMLSKMDVVIFLKDFKCMEVTEIAGYDYKNNRIIYNPVYRFDFRTNKFTRLNPSCSRLQDKIDYYNYKKRRRIEAC